MSTVIESHPETPQSLHIDKAFPSLLEYATSLDFEGMDVTDHGHVPYVVILVRLLEDWKKTVSVVHIVMSRLNKEFIAQRLSAIELRGEAGI